VVYAGAIGITALNDDNTIGRLVPTVGGVMSEALIGLVPALLMQANGFVHPIESGREKPRSVLVVATLGALAGGVLGGYIAWRASEGDGTDRSFMATISYLLPWILTYTVALN
jgi:hypothetical protein